MHASMHAIYRCHLGQTRPGSFWAQNWEVGVTRGCTAAAMRTDSRARERGAPSSVQGGGENVADLLKCSNEATPDTKTSDLTDVPRSHGSATSDATGQCLWKPKLAPRMLPRAPRVRCCECTHMCGIMAHDSIQGGPLARRRREGICTFSLVRAGTTGNGPRQDNITWNQRVARRFHCWHLAAEDVFTPY